MRETLAQLVRSKGFAAAFKPALSKLLREAKARGWKNIDVDYPRTGIITIFAQGKNREGSKVVLSIQLVLTPDLKGTRTPSIKTGLRSDPLGKWSRSRKILSPKDVE